MVKRGMTYRRRRITGEGNVPMKKPKEVSWIRNSGIPIVWDFGRAMI